MELSWADLNLVELSWIGLSWAELDRVNLISVKLGCVDITDQWWSRPRWTANHKLVLDEMVQLDLVEHPMKKLELVKL